MERYYRFYEEKITAGIIIALIAFVVIFVAELFK